MYTPNPPGRVETPQQAADYVYQELNKLAEALNSKQDYLLINERYAEPDKLFEGLLVQADGVTWDPGSGPGLYFYTGGSWKNIPLV